MSETVAPETAVAPPSGRAALEAERDFLLRSLADLNRERAAGDIGDDDYATLCSDYTARAADVLRRLDGTPRVPRPPVGRAVPPRPPWRAPLVIAVVVAFAIGSGVLVARTAGERVGNAGLTGNVRTAAPSPAQTAIDALMTEGRTHMSDDPVRALKAFEAAEKLDPTQVEAIAYSGWILRLVGRSSTDQTQAKELFAAAHERLDRAVAVDPTYPDALAFRGILLLRDEGNPAAALADFTALQQLNPPEFIQQLVAGAKAEARTQAENTTTTVSP